MIPSGLTFLKYPIATVLHTVGHLATGQNLNQVITPTYSHRLREASRSFVAGRVSYPFSPVSSPRPKI
jgi:hypothetical protein